MFKINGDDWRVVFVSPYHPMLKKKDGSYTLGACVDDTKKIYINNKLSLEKVKQVLCHEITHAAMFSYDIQLTYDQEELLADLLATYGQEVIDITNKIFSKIKNNTIPEKSPGFATANFHLKKLEKNPRNQLKNIDTHGRIVKIWAEISMPGSSSEMNT